jgi:ABC-type Mn2+/Zn2+ transport system ATPase subunit
VVGPGEVLVVRDADVGYGGRPVVRGISLALRGGETLGIVGPNGSGKTTFLKTVLGLLPPVAGVVETAPGFRVGYVPQRESMEPVLPLSAREVVSMAARADAWLPFAARRERRAMADEALARVGLADRADRPYRDLSGGQRQRILLARALAVRPTVLALDEPTTGLDLSAEVALLDLVASLQREQGLTVLFISHSLALVADAAAQVLLFHEGRHREGPSEEILSEGVLRDLYGVEVHVARVAGRRVIAAFPGRKP